MLQKFNKFYHWWVHPEIRSNVLYDQVCWQSLLAHLYAMVIYVTILSLTEYFEYPYGRYSIALGYFFSISTFIFCRYSNRFPLIFFGSLCQYAVMIFIMSYGDGGFFSLNSIAYLGILWWAFYYGERMGFLFSISFFVAMLVVFILQWQGFEFPKVWPKENEFIKNAFIVFTHLSMYSIVFWLANKNNQRIRMKLEKSEQQLLQQEKMASLGQLTAGVAHEINNPINFISSGVDALELDFEDLKKLFDALEALQTNPTPNEKDLQKIISLSQELDSPFLKNEIQDLIDGIKRGVTRTKNIVNGLRVFSRNNSDFFEEADIHEAIDSALIILNNLITNQVTVVKNYDNLFKIKCQVSQLNQVFVNLINNSIQAMNGKGQLQIKTWQEEKNVLIQIKDDGEGMDAETQKRIFEPFFTTKKVGKGTGLGLSISYGIIQNHHGEILVNSQKGKGSTFTIRLPFSK